MIIASPAICGVTVNMECRSRAGATVRSWHLRCGTPGRLAVADRRPLVYRRVHAGSRVRHGDETEPDPVGLLMATGPAVRMPARH